MRVLLSTIGSRGDVQPLVALALQLRALGAGVHLCVPPDFEEGIQSLGFAVTPVGPDLRKATAAATPVTKSAGPPTPEQRRQMAAASVADQFERVALAAQGCDVIVGASALQIAARSIAETMGIPYVFAAYCPTVLPSLRHAPIPLPGQTPAPDADNRSLWAQNAERFNDTFGEALNSHRASLNLPAISDVSRHIFTDRPWLAADQTLGPWPDAADPSVFQTGAWVVKDERPLPDEVDAFLDAGDSPVYFGFGSMRAPQGLGQVMIEAATALGRRAIVSRGWADLSLADNAANYLAVGEINLQALFKRVAAAVHHGGAGTTTIAALAGAPQVIVPQLYDQYYWAQRIEHLGIGAAHAPGAPTAESLTNALQSVLKPDVAARAKSVAGTIKTDGALVAARKLTR
jgi:vancomycin aglycone glucosyltransferase